MKSRTLRLLVISQATVTILLLLLTLSNEFLDLPHYLFNDVSTSLSQRVGEIVIELVIFATVMIIQIMVLLRLCSRIRILEGFIPICANCKKTRNKEEQWEEIEEYITQHSLAKFSHTICPDCARQLYPNLYSDRTQRTK